MKKLTVDQFMSNYDTRFDKWYPELRQQRIEWGKRMGYVKLDPVTSTKTIGRNDPCLCGSGKKYKKCCINKGETS